MFWCYVCWCYLGPGRWLLLERWLPYRGRLQCFSAMLVLFGAREAGWFREVAALHNDLYRQFSLLQMFTTETFWKGFAKVLQRSLC